MNRPAARFTVSIDAACSTGQRIAMGKQLERVIEDVVPFWRARLEGRGSASSDGTAGVDRRIAASRVPCRGLPDSDLPGITLEVNVVHEARSTRALTRHRSPSMRRTLLALTLATAAAACDDTTGTVSGQLTVFVGAGTSGIHGGPGVALPRGIDRADVDALRAKLPRGNPLLKAPPDEVIVPGEVIVRTADADIDPEALLEKLPGASLRLAHKGFASRHLHLVAATHADGRVPDADETRALATSFAKVEGVRFAEPNRLQFPSAVPDDRHYGLQWHYPAMNLPAAWDVTTGRESLVVAVIDTGFARHPDLDPRVVQGIDMITDAARALDGDGRDDDATDPGGDLPQGASSWHGTHVAGTIGAATNNRSNVAGVDWNARLLPVRVLGKGGGTLFDIVAGITWAAGGEVPGVRANATPAKVLNLSLGGSGNPSPTYQDGIDTATGLGAIVVVAAGNENENTVRKTPCNQENVICVGATRFSGRRASYSNYGPQVDVMAPGGELGEDANGDGHPDGVLSTYRDGSSAAVQFLQGTSMATPHVAGLVALMKGLTPGLTTAQAESALKETASAHARCNEGCGAGLVNAYAAVLRVRGEEPAGPAKLALTSNELTLTSDRVAALGIGNVGGRNLSVKITTTGEGAERLSFPDGTQLTVAPGRTEQLTIDADFAGLGDRVVGAQVVLTTNGGNATVQVRIDARAKLLQAEAIVAIVEEDEHGEWHVRGAAFAPGADGFRWRATDVPPGEYFVLAAIDLDGDEEFLEEGEPWGLYEDFANPRTITLEEGGRVEGVDFLLVPFSNVGDAPEARIGAPCRTDADCDEGGFCATWDGGYCSYECSLEACPGGAPCYDFEDDGRFCLSACTVPDRRAECRAGYWCYENPVGGGVCAPD